MRVLDKVCLRLRSLFERPKVERELDSELRFHLDQLVEEEIAAGVAPADARASALRKMGGLSQFQEECRDMRRVNFIDDFLRDLRYAIRSLRRSPGFATLTVLIMALGIGANTAVFSVVNAVLLKPLSYRDPDRIVTLSDFLRTGEAPTALSKQVSIPDFQDWHDQSSSFEAMAYYSSREEAMIANGATEFARRTPVSPEFFRVLGVEPIVGRPFTAEEMKRGSGGAAMISYAFWQSHFGGDPRVLGQIIRAPGPRPIAGVMPPGFRFPNNTDVWVSAVGPPGGRAAQNLFAIGRLKASVTLEQAQAEMTTIAGRLEQQYPESNSGRGVTVTKMRDDMVGNVRLMLYLLLSAVSVVLLIACANTATLLLVKATTRTREVAVRTALGANRPRIVRQLVTESLLLAFLAGGAGLILAYWGSTVLVSVAPANVPRLAEAGIDRAVLIFTLGVSVITSVLFGLVPALYASRVDLSDCLKQGATRLLSGRGVSRVRGVLVVAEIALTAVLLCGAGLLINSFVALQNVALGFRPENTIVQKD